MTTLNECEDTVNELAIVEPQLAIEDYLITDEVNIQLLEVSCIDKGKQKMDTQTSIDDVDTRNYSRPVYLTGVENEDSICSTVYDSPNGTRYWTPIVRDEFKPIVGSVFAKWDDVVFMYDRYMMCTKVGKPHGVVFDSLDKSPIRRTNFKVTDCKARIKVRYIEDTSNFQLYEHIENHNHGLINSDNLDLSKKKRRLNFSDKEYIAKCCLANVGPSKAHRLQVALKGAHHIVRGIFWADDVSKKNYKVFGDVLAFDATYQTNMFNQRLLEHSTTTTTPQFRTTMNIECNANEIYTRTIFKEVQKEIYKSTTLCYIWNQNIVNGIHTYCVTHQDNRHHKIENIPTQYVHNRWRRGVLPRSMFSMSNRYCVDQSESSTTRNRIVDNIQQIVDRIRNDPERLALLDKEMEAIKEKIFQELPYSQINQTKNAIIQELVNVSEPSNIKYTISLGIRNKGCGTNRRLIGPGEKAIINSQKPKRKCRYCNKMVNNHDSRNFPVKKKDMEEFASTNHDTDEEEYQINADGCSDVDDKLEDSDDFEVNEDDYASK
ncbi:hypothetical protein E3N88_29626 [Mikania micrantha]|uniref:Uncharacterized protein n=1 Tax=Mikania micrantha TaxID=192012 RepID=A0A5N6MJS7_9ASTR|nr:hypothetical protein E3N88_29626 [Mikania micrantha]